MLGSKVFDGSWVGQVGQVKSMTRVRNSDLSLVNSHNLSWVGQAGRVESLNWIQKTDPNRSNQKPYVTAP